MLEELELKDDKLFKLALALEKVALEDDYFIKRKLYPNVDFYSGIVYESLGIQPDLFTPIFAIARVAGWLCRFSSALPRSNRMCSSETPR